MVNFFLNIIQNHSKAKISITFLSIFCKDCCMCKKLIGQKPITILCWLVLDLTCRVFREYSKNYFVNQLLLMSRIFNGIFLCMKLFVMFLFHFLWNIPGIFQNMLHWSAVNYSWNILWNVSHYAVSCLLWGYSIFYRIFLEYSTGYTLA